MSEAKIISEVVSLEDLVLLGDKIHNAEELICLTHKQNNEEHDVFFAMIGEQDSLAHLIAHQCCSDETFFKVIALAMKKLGYEIIDFN
jgi:hypothetical protein